MERLTRKEIEKIHYDVHGFYVTGMEAFATEIERVTLIRAATVCERRIKRAGGHGGTWEGLGPFMAWQTGQECAIALRAVAGMPDEP
jgi:hypothetical protein